MLALLALLGVAPVDAAAPRGHVKLAASTIDLPSDSLFTDGADDVERAALVDLRLGWQGSTGNWYWQADYQLQSLDGESLPGIATRAALDDETRLFDLTDRFHQGEASLAQQRLDRLSLGYRGANLVVNVGRQAISWGNGVVFNPVDLFNPFDPAAFDTEFKPGDDMLYAQLLLADGSDLQAVGVARRDADGHADSEVASFAVKYHAFAASGEFDLLAGRHYDADVAALGGAADLRTGLWRGDILLGEDGGERVASAVVNWSTTTRVSGRNLGLTVEYFHGGHGIGDGDYSPARLAAETELTARLDRGELFTLARNYLAASLSLEINPLWLFDATLIANLDDDSRRLLLVSRHDPDPSMLLRIAADLPIGEDGSEYGGLPAAVPGRTLGVDAVLSAQLAWYF